MPLLKELLSDWVGVLSLITILAVLVMAGYYLPDGMSAQHFYRPTTRGLEGKIGEKMAWLESLDKAARERPAMPPGKAGDHD